MNKDAEEPNQGREKLPAGVRSELPSADSAEDKSYPKFSFLARLLMVYCGYDNEQELLQKQYPWLKDLTSVETEQGNVELLFAESRKAFLHDGNLFMVTLRRFVLADLRMELYHSFVQDQYHGAHIMHLLHLLHQVEEKTPTTTFSGGWDQMRVQPEDARIPEGSGFHYDWAAGMVKKRSFKRANASLRKNLYAERR